MRPFRFLRRTARRWGRHLAAGLGLQSPLADRGYMICATPRSGSNYLCQLLASTGQLGIPLEYFNTIGRRKSDPGYPKDRYAQIEIVRSRGATPNGIYALKVMPLQYRRVRERVDLLRALPNLTFVRLRRRDLLGQAISLSRARQTGQLMSSNPALRQPIYDVQDIRTCIADVRRMQSSWDQVMRDLGLQPITFDYEEVMRDPQAAIDGVAALMGLAAPPPVNPAMVRVSLQRNQESEAWRQRFLEETGEEFRHLAAL